MSNPSSSFGSYTGNGTSQSIETGYKPNYVKVWNSTDDDKVAEHIQGMADGAIIVTDTDVSEAASGITLVVNGFSVGANDAVNENAKVFKYIAMR